MNNNALKLIEIMDSIGVNSQARFFLDNMPVAEVDDILGVAIKYLGENYKEIVQGLFVSEDDERIFRMLDSDLGYKVPHVHFNTREGLNYGKKGLNYHISFNE
jgi:hypothetical protein